MKAIVIFIFGIFLFSCAKSASKKVKDGYFTKEYTNWAWGSQHNGWVINKDGDILSFNLPQSWNHPDSLGYISEQNLLDNISNCEKTKEKVSGLQLNKHTKLIKNASMRSLSEKKSVGIDGGGNDFYCYWYDEEVGKYKKVRLLLRGDYRQENLSD
jgi:hypothetical protein